MHSSPTQAALDNMVRGASTTTRCLPVVSVWTTPEGRNKYIAEIRFSSAAPSPSQGSNGRPLYIRRDEAFKALAEKVKRLPELMRDYVIVIGNSTYTDADKAAQAVVDSCPMADDIAPR